mgnify:CR=1 FL=1
MAGLWADAVTAGEAECCSPHGYRPVPGAFDTAAIKLLSSSMAVDKGTNVSEVTDDFFGTARAVGSAFDIGAHELK